MTLFSFAFIFIGSICFALGYLHLIIFMQRRDLKVDLFFSLMAFAISYSSFFEIWAFKADTLTAYLPLFRATLMVQCILWVCFAWFVFSFTNSVRLWPPILITFLYSLAALINTFSPATILFQEITEFIPYTMWSGEVIYLGSGPANRWRIVADIAWIILLVYTAVACVQFAKQGNVRKAAVFGTTVFLCLGLGYLHGTLIDLGFTDPPYLGSFLFLPLLLVMSSSLAGEVVRASQLSREIKSAEARWRNFHENVQLVVLGIDSNKNVYYVNPFFLELTGYTKELVLGQPFIGFIPPQEREAMTDRLEEVLSRKSEIKQERMMPIVTASGEVKEIVWSNVLLSNSGSSSAGTLSIGKDITDQLQAESARDRAIEELKSLKEKLEEENISLKEIIQSGHSFTEIIGRSNSLLYVLSKVHQVAQTDSTVLILGETGTGKELVARAIHRESKRADKPFIRVNCAAIPSDLVESELFGHEPGSFTNAVSLRKGKFELAEGGTIFLDEISEMPLDIQAKLLTVLQEKELERVGGSTTIPVNVRVVSATNRDLSKEMAEGRFRADLFYRLNVYPVTVPPLRSRKDDIPMLVQHFIALYNKKFGKDVQDVPGLVMESLSNYDWPGNVRELQNILERAVITSDGTSLRLPDELRLPKNTSAEKSRTDKGILPLEEVERRHILHALQKTNWQVGGMKGAARILQMNPSTLRSRIKKLGLKKP